MAVGTASLGTKYLEAMGRCLDDDGKSTVYRGLPRSADADDGGGDRGVYDEKDRRPMAVAPLTFQKVLTLR